MFQETQELSSEEQVETVNLFFGYLMDCAIFPLNN